MRDAILIQQCWKGNVGGLGDYLPLMKLTLERNRAYCDIHGFDFQPIVGPVLDKFEDVKKGGWPKVELIRRALADGYHYIVWMDPDALIRDLDTDLREGCPKGIGACWHRIPQLNHWNVGALYIQNSPQVMKFIEDWLGSFPGLPNWMEQGEFNRLAMESNVVKTISDRWNSTINYSMVPDAVVIGYHGYGDALMRLDGMKETLKNLEAQ